MRNITGQAVVDDDLYGRDYEIARLWEKLEQGEHILMLAPRRVGKTSLMLELDRAPRKNWDVIYVDVERGDSPADCIASIFAEFAAMPQYRSRFKAIPFSNAVKDVLGRLSVSVDTGVLRVELKDAIGREWDHAADQLTARLTSLPSTGSNLLVIWSSLMNCHSSFRGCCGLRSGNTTPSCCCLGFGPGAKRQNCAPKSVRLSVDRSDSKESCDASVFQARSTTSPRFAWARGIGQPLSNF